MTTIARILRRSLPSLSALLAVGALGASGALAASPAPSAPAASPMTSSNMCPQAFDAAQADYYPVQPSFSAGYSAAGQLLNSDTADWAYVVSGDYPYSYWMAWYLYDTKGVPLFKVSDTDIAPDAGSTNPFVPGNPILAPTRHYSITFMPADTPANVITSMQAAGQNVALLPAVGSTPGVSIVFRSYWSLSNDELGDYDRFGYGGPTQTPHHRILAFETDPTTGELTDTPVSDCGAQSQLPQKLWYDPADELAGPGLQEGHPTQARGPHRPAQVHASGRFRLRRPRRGVPAGAGAERGPVLSQRRRQLAVRRRPVRTACRRPARRMRRVRHGEPPQRRRLARPRPPGPHLP